MDRGREGFHDLRRRGEVRRRESDPRRHGPGPARLGADRGHDHHQCPHRRPLGNRESRRGLEGRSHLEGRQGRQSRHPARRHDPSWPRHRGDRGRRHDPHRGRRRQPHSFHLPAADQRGADVGRHDDAGRGHRASNGYCGDDMHARTVAPALDALRRRGLSDEPRLPRQGQRQPARGAARAGARGGDRLEAARGLGHDARGDRLLPRRRRRDGCSSGHPHRHAQRIGLRRGERGGVQGPHHPHVPHRRRRRRARARHHQGRGTAERAAVIDQSDAPLHRQHHRRAPRHAHGVPPPRSGDRRGRGVRRVAHPQGDHRRRGHPARPRCLLDDVVGLAGDGARGRGGDQDLADRAQDEGAAGQPEGRPFDP